jgi:membrane-associated phospholipid phosphatase
MALTLSGARRGFGRRDILGAVLAGAIVMAPKAAWADGAGTSGTLQWDLEWSHAGPADYSLTMFGVGVAAIYVPLLQNRQPPLHWARPILFDEAVRNRLRAPTVEGRKNAGLASWGLFGAVIADPLIDVGYVWEKYGSDVAWDLFWQDATAMSLATAFDLNLRDIVGRARPPVTACMIAGGSAAQCMGTSEESTRSFPGGHVMIVTTAAALVCTQHLTMHLYGSPWDAIACSVAVGADAAVGVLRIVSDDHWATDILSGYALGAAFGWGIPALMHLHAHARPLTDPGLRLVPIAMPVERGAGMGVTGWF